MQATLLIVESDRESGQVLSTYLRQQSYQVVLVENIAEAQKALELHIQLFDLQTVSVLRIQQDDDASLSMST